MVVQVVNSFIVSTVSRWFPSGEFHSVCEQIKNTRRIKPFAVAHVSGLLGYFFPQQSKFFCIGKFQRNLKRELEMYKNNFRMFFPFNVYTNRCINKTSKIDSE